MSPPLSSMTQSGLALDHLLEVDPGLTSADAYEMVSSVMGRVFEEGVLIQTTPSMRSRTLTRILLSRLSCHPLQSPPSRTATRAALRRTLRSAGKAAEKLRKGKGPKNFSMNETLRRSFGR